MQKPSNDTERAIWFQAYCAALGGILGRDVDGQSFQGVAASAAEHASWALERYRDIA